jgi:hypothetical protein
MPIELYEDKSDGSYVIKDGDSVLKLSKEDFDEMRRDGRSPLLRKLWDQAKRERQVKRVKDSPG